MEMSGLCQVEMSGSRYAGRMSAAVLTMSQREFERAALIRRVHERRLTQSAAAELLGLSLRQVSGSIGTVPDGRARRRSASGKRGRPATAKLPVRSREARPWRVVRSPLHRLRADVGAGEARRGCHGVDACRRRRLRRWMTEDGLRVPHARRRDRVYQPRRRETASASWFRSTAAITSGSRGVRRAAPDAHPEPENLRGVNLAGADFGETALAQDLRPGLHVSDDR